MEGSIEQMYPRSKGDYEKYVEKLSQLINRHTFEKDKKNGGAHSVVILGAMLDQCLGEASPEEIRELNRCVGEIINRKIDQQNKELGKVKSKLKGAKLFEDGAADFSKIEDSLENEEKVSEEEKLRIEKEQEEREKRDRLAQADLKRKEGERVELQKAMKKEERKVDTSHFAGMQMMKKDDDDMFFGGGKKKGKKK